MSNNHVQDEIVANFGRRPIGQRRGANEADLFSMDSLEVGTAKKKRTMERLERTAAVLQAPDLVRLNMVDKRPVPGIPLGSYFHDGALYPPLQLFRDAGPCAT